MSRIIFIRHGESQANAGIKTTDPTSITLTPKGLEQSIAVIPAEPPTLILTSKYLRTLQTAQPTLDRYPGVPHEVWEIHEFTYLAPDKYCGTTVQERTPMAEKYWLQGDPGYCDGPGAESFNAFVGRCGRVIGRLRGLKGGTVAAFSHQQFISGLIWHLEGRLNRPDQKTMHDFRAYLIAYPIKNCVPVEFTV